MTFEERFRRLGRKGHHEAVIGLRQVHHQIVRLTFHTGDPHHRFAEVGLRFARCVRQGNEHLAGAQGLRLASYGTMLLAAATILGCLILPALAERFGRRITMALFFACMFVFILLAFGHVFYLNAHALPWFFACLFFLGLGGANFAMYTLWLPEQYPTDCRASAFAFATSAARFAGAGITFLVGAGVAYFHTIGIPIAITSVAFVVGLALLPLGVETKGSGLPA